MKIHDFTNTATGVLVCFTTGNVVFVPGEQMDIKKAKKVKEGDPEPEPEFEFEEIGKKKPTKEKVEK